MVASQDWPEVTKYAGLVSAQPHREELIQDLFKTWKDPQRGTVTGGMVRYVFEILNARHDKEKSFKYNVNRFLSLRYLI